MTERISELFPEASAARASRLVQLIEIAPDELSAMCQSGTSQLHSLIDLPSLIGITPVGISHADPYVD